MKASISILLGLMMSTPAYAGQQDEIADSLASMALDEVVVEAQMQNATAQVAAYIPVARQKDVAKDAISLLNLMSIPQLSIDPVAESVKTVAGQPVSIFIDYTEASSEDISGLRPRDVKRVEYYNSPSDPRFSGKRYVINFIMQKYEWGGYTKIDATQSLGVIKTDASVYSRMKYKAMSYDIYVGGQYDVIGNAGSEIVEDMRFTDLFGNGPANIGRLNDNTTETTHNNTNDVSFRAIYDSDKFQINNRISLNYISAPESKTTNNLIYDSGLSESVKTHSISSSSNITAGYSGQYIVMLPKGLTLNVGTRFEYGSNDVNSLYCGAGDFSISNNAHERSCFGTVNPNLYWQINDLHSIRVYSVGMWRNNRINYAGSSSSRQTYGIGGYQAGASYDFNTDQWNAHLNLGWTWQTNTISDYRIKTSYPRVNAEVVYSPTHKSQLLASYEYYETFPTASSTSPVMLQQDELMWYAGNPDLRNSPTHEVALQGIWFPSNKWQVAITGFHYNMTDRRVAGYLPEGPGGTMLRCYTNDGDYMNTMIGLNATAKFFGGKLTARVNPQLWLRKTTGVFAMRRNELTCTAQLTYYFSRFYVMGWYGTPSHYPDENSGVESKTPSQYQLQAGWGNGSWNIGISASNFLRSDWRANREILRSEYYNMSSKVYSPSQHMKFAVTATYIFDYGKKVGHNNEMKQGSSAHSAILK